MSHITQSQNLSSGNEWWGWLHNSTHTSLTPLNCTKMVKTVNFTCILQLKKKKAGRGKKVLTRSTWSGLSHSLISFSPCLLHSRHTVLPSAAQTHQTHSYLTALCINLHVGGPLSVIQNSPSSLTPQKGLPQYTLYHLTLIILSIPITSLVTVSLPLWM